MSPSFLGDCGCLQNCAIFDSIVKARRGWTFAIVSANLFLRETSTQLVNAKSRERERHLAANNIPPHAK
jgi:hypothetical protein